MGRKAAPSNRRNEGTQNAEGHSEAAWKAMTAIERDESDRWNDVEEHLLRAQEQDPKHWKYFAK